VPAHHHTGLGAEGCFFELEGQVFAQICAALNPAASTAATERIAKAEELAENIAQVLEGCTVKSSACPSGITDSGVAEAIV
jgi:hypothetical protein